MILENVHCTVYGGWLYGIGIGIFTYACIMHPCKMHMQVQLPNENANVNVDFKFKTGIDVLYKFIDFQFEMCAMENCVCVYVAYNSLFNNHKHRQRFIIHKIPYSRYATTIIIQNTYKLHPIKKIKMKWSWNLWAEMWNLSMETIGN